MNADRVHRPAGRRENPTAARRRSKPPVDPLGTLGPRGLLESIMQATDVMLAYLDTDFNFVWVNGAYAEGCRRRPEELIGRNHFDLYPHAENEAIFARVRDTGEPVFYEDKPFEFPDQPDRGITYWDWSLVPVKDARGAVEGLVFSLRETTPHKKAEEALRLAHERMGAILDSITDAFFALDRRWRFTYLNSEAERLLRKTGGEAIGRSVWDLFPGADAFRRRYEQVLETGRSVHFEEWYAPLGTWFEVHAYPSPDGISVYFRDITERRRADEALERREAEFRALIENVDSGVALVDAEGRFNVYNRRFLEMFGFSPDADVLNVNSRDWSAWHVFDEDGTLLDVDEHPVRKAARTGEPVSERLVAVRPPSGGDPVWMQVSVVPIRGEDGRLERMICTYHDVSRRKRAEEQVRQLNQSLERRNRELDAERMRWQGVVEGIADEMWVCDAEGRMSLINLPETTAMKLAEFEDLSVYEVLEDVDITYLDGTPRPPEEAPLLRSLRTGQVVRGEEIMRDRRSGRERVRQFSCAPMRDQAGRITGAVAVVRDITEIKRTEEALREADRRKNEFLALLSHELRNPLEPIMSGLYVLEHAAPGGDDARRAQVIIDRQVRQLVRLVDDLLDVTRITRNKIKLQRQRLEVNDLVRRTIEDYRRLFEDNGVTLELEVAPIPVFFDADWNRLAQVIGNLLQNAAKFTARGGTTRVSVERDERRRMASVRVADTGVGMTPDTLARIFRPFVQADTTLDRSKGGLGLGLALVKGVVELHGGEVEARSAGLDRGSEFIVSLPVLEEEPAQAKESSLSQRQVARRILIIEDNADGAESLRLALECLGHEVATAGDGSEGITRAREFRPDVLFCDIGLPGMDGYEVARAFRADAALRGTYLVALSGYAQPEDLQRAAEAGFDRHVAKPPTIESLQEVLSDRPGDGR